MPRPRSLLPLLMLAAALPGACRAPAQEGAAVNTAPAATQTAPPSPTATDPSPAEAGYDPRPVSRVVLGGGLTVEDLRIGDGPPCAGPDSTITVRYRGELASSGEIFDATAPGKLAELPLDRLIKGWKEGVPGMRVGGVRRLTIPAALAYGSRGLVQGDDVVIPPGADLVFEIELLGVR